MKKYLAANRKKLQKLIFLSILSLLSGLKIMSQDYASITGKLEDESNHNPISYAGIALYTLSDHKLLHGQISDTSGYFLFKKIPEGKYLLQISVIGYEQISKEINISDGTPYDEGIICLKQSIINLEETVITAERSKGKAENNKTTYFITKKMSDASDNGMDIIRLIPGVQVDIHRNISLEGNSNILILVDGNERDNYFLGQIDPALIDRVEIMSAPPSNYDGDFTGAVNIILKKEKNTGMNGHINLEIPLSGKQVYIHPDYHFSISYQKLNMFTSYNSELIRFNQHESVFRKITIRENIMESGTDQYVRQNLWSHRFHIGVDYDPTPATRINLYAFYNPYSQEYEGDAKSYSNLNGNFLWEAERSSSDLNHNTFYSMHFKHIMNERGAEFNLDVSNYHLLGENRVKYQPVSTDSFSSYENHTMPVLNVFSLKADGIFPVGKTIKIGLGGRTKINAMEDRKVTDFSYLAKVFSSYISMSYGKEKYDLDWGIRLEKSTSALKNSFRKPLVSILPYASFISKISSDKSLKLTLSKTIYRPNLYQLNPNQSKDDPVSIRTGNPDLDPEIRTSVFVEYSKKIKSNFYSVKVFYNKNHNCINNLTRLNDASVFETGVYNLGDVHELGFQISGTLKAGELITFIPYLRIYGLNSFVNHISEDFSIQNRKQAVIESGFSSVLAFKKGFNLLMNLQYNSPKNNIQGNSYSDPLCFISVEKTFKSKFKAGVATVLPFNNPFTYQGYETKSGNFYSRYTGDIRFSSMLIWLKLSYCFNSGMKHEKSSGNIDESDILIKKGF